MTRIVNTITLWLCLSIISIPIYAQIEPLPVLIPPVFGKNNCLVDLKHENYPTLFLCGETEEQKPYTGLFQFTDSTISPISINLPQLQKPVAAWGDINSDGFPELYLSGFNPESNKIEAHLYNNVQGVLSETTCPFQAVSDGVARFASLTGDGTVDLIISGITSSDARVAKTFLYSRQNGVFVEQSIFIPGMYRASIDIFTTGNGEKLLALTGSSTISEYCTRIYKCNQSFTRLNTSDLPDLKNGSAKWVELQKTGKVALVATGISVETGLPYLGLFSYENEQLVPIVLPVEPRSSATVNVQDIDSDGLAEIILSGASGQNSCIELLKNNDGAFSVENTELPCLNQLVISCFPESTQGELFILCTGYDWNNKITVSLISIR